MAAGGFKEFVAGETLDQDEINDFLMQGMLVFAGTAARGSAITSPVEGQFTYLADSDKVEFYDSTQWVELSSTIEIEYLVIGGGGGGGTYPPSVRAAGGGGAGGYRANVSGENSGGNTSAERALSIAPGTYSIIVGGGAAGTTGTSRPLAGDSAFGPITAVGGGYGGQDASRNGLRGGSGGGSHYGPYENLVGLSIVGQGSDSGQGLDSGTSSGGGGGGGASAVGGNASSGNGGNGGAGLSSSITGSSVGRGGGGGGSGNTGGSATDGGGAGVSSGNGNAGTANTGGGGGAARQGTGGNGGSGLVVFTVPAGTSVTFSAGVTQSSAVVSGKDVYTVTATSTTSETVTIG